MLQQYAARNRERNSSRDIGGIAVSATRAGLPRIIPKEDRILIRKGDPKMISFWLSLLNVYRVLDCKYKFQGMYDTIWKPGTNWKITEECSLYIGHFWKVIDQKFKNTAPKLPGFKPFLINKSSIHSRPATSLPGMITFVHSIRKTMYRFKDGLGPAITQACVSKDHTRHGVVYETQHSAIYVMSLFR